jgi:AcrR family transcriptional regulator
MPKLWTTTIEAHREAVREAVLDAAGQLVEAHGVHAATMSEIADTAGIGRATLYKYFPDLEAVLSAWHERQVAKHLAQLVAIGHAPGTPGERLAAALGAYALSQRADHGGDAQAVAALHQSQHVQHAQQHLIAFISELVRKAADAGEVRKDVSPDELARYCLSALGAASTMPSAAAVRRLVAVTIAGLQLQP